MNFNIDTKDITVWSRLNEINEAYRKLREIKRKAANPRLTRLEEGIKTEQENMNYYLFSEVA